jgi:phenylacetyl-CoA:acceptor oxidoreductase subunit 1
MHWGMVIDTNRCIACYGCVIACKEENFVPAGVFFNRVLIGEEGKYPNVVKINLPVLCNHCKEAPCVEACPSGATKRREDGIVFIDYDQCVGCRTCLIACPYQQRTYVDKIHEYYPGQGFTKYEEFVKDFFPTKVTVKCTFCMDRIDEGLRRGLKPGVDNEATPACVIACPSRARVFGDLDDPNSEVSALISEKRGEQIHPEFETDPSVYYIRR